MKSGKFITHPLYSKGKPPFPFETVQYQSMDTPFESGNGLLNIKKGFSLNTTDIKKVTVRATSLGIFDMFLNGRRIGEDKDGYADEFKPGWTDYRIRVYEYEYEVTELCKGENLFVSEISDGWWSGRITYNMYGTRPVAFACEFEIEYKNGVTEIFGTDENWDTSICGPVLRADIWDGEYYDATIPKPCISPDFHSWEKAILYEYEGVILPKAGPSVRVRADLERVPQTAVKYFGTKNNGTLYGKINITESKKGTGCEKTLIKACEGLILDAGQNMVGRPVISIKAKKGTKITIHFAEMLNDSGDDQRGNDGPMGRIYVKNYRSALSRCVYVASGEGLEVYYPTHTFFGFRYIEIHADSDVEINSVRFQVICSEFEETGSFVCDHEDVNQLYSNIVWGMRGNYLSIPTDCPQRDERFGWTGDTQIFCGAASYLGNIQSFMHKWLYDISDSQIGRDGAYGDFAPIVLPWAGNAAWGDAGLIVPHRIWLMYGDEEIIRRQYDSMEWYMKFLSQYGLEGPNTTYGDWLNYDDTDKRYIAVSFYAYDASLMAKFSQILCKAEKEAYYTDLKNKIIKHWTDRYVKDNHLTINTQTGYILALAFNLSEGQTKSNIIKSLKEKIIENNYTLSTGFVGTGVLAQTLEKSGLSNLAYSLLLQTDDPSWLYSVKQGATTVWERWNSYTESSGFGDVSMNSFNHYSYGAVCEWFYSGICGIVPDENAPGFEHFFLCPSPDMRKDEEIPKGQKRINHAKATYKSIKGVIKSGWEKTDDAFRYEFIIPKGTKATVKLVNGDEININGTSYTTNKISDFCPVSNRVMFDLPEGKYVILVK